MVKLKRSHVNRIIKDAIDFFESQNISLPEFAYWNGDDWNRDESALLKQLNPGWEIWDPDGCFKKVGVCVLDVRKAVCFDDGIQSRVCENYMMVREGQFCPWHYHRKKVEDIRNSGGGVLAVQLAQITADGKPDTQKPVLVKKNYAVKEMAAGSVVLLHPGDSMILDPMVYHQFWAVEGNGNVVFEEVFEAIEGNDDHFLDYPPEKHLKQIEEDEPALYPLMSERN